MKIVQKQLTTAAFPISARAMERESTSTQDPTKKKLQFKNEVYRDLMCYMFICIIKLVTVGGEATE